MGRLISSMAAVVFLVGLVLSTSPAKALTDCKTVIANVFPCSNFLKNPTNALPERSCCNAARSWNHLGDVESLCKCLQPIASQFHPTKAHLLPTLCDLGAAILPFVKCLLPPFALPPLPFVPPAGSGDVPLPPLPFGPLPPLPFGPLPPLPFPLPPLPFGPLPPLPFGPLPPLPFGPLPPLPFGPLPPLPPLPFVPPAEKQN